MRILFDIILILIGFIWSTLVFLTCDEDKLNQFLNYRDYFKWIRGEEDERESDESDN